MRTATKAPYKLIVQTDDTCKNPRERADKFGKIACFYEYRHLGEEHEDGTPEEFLRRVIAENITAKQTDRIVQDAKAGRFGGIHLDYDYSTREYTLRCYQVFSNAWSTARVFPSPMRQKPEACKYILRLLDLRQLESLAQTILEMLPLFVYGSDGTTLDAFSLYGTWDNGQVGWIYTTSREIEERFQRETAPHSMEMARKLLREEVRQYTHFLQGDCYAYHLYKDGVKISSRSGYLGSYQTFLNTIVSELPKGCESLPDDLSPEKIPLLKRVRARIKASPTH